MSQPAQAPDPTMIELVREGWKRCNQLYGFLTTNPVNPAYDWPPHFMFLATLCLASSIAKLMQTPRAEFIGLAASFYDCVDIKESKEPLQNSTFGEPPPGSGF